MAITVFAFHAKLQTVRTTKSNTSTRQHPIEFQSIQPALLMLSDGKTFFLNAFHIEAAGRVTLTYTFVVLHSNTYLNSKFVENKIGQIFQHGKNVCISILSGDSWKQNLWSSRWFPA